ncbi:GNAT family N-acetyltransferase [Pseudonocardia sp. GCM10023141]|uniref:GNAT family N-acetyltransferase n=1 Tax=Pseudonocardia sp. GCM10023141 TaxID=3252653 RepID=UPI00361BAA00
MPVRPAEPADLDAICAMIKAHAELEGGAVALHLTELHETLFADHAIGHALIATPPGSTVPAGCALWYRTFSTWAGRRGIWLEDLYVEPEHRRHGLGRELLMALRAATTGRVEWDVARANDGAQAFYRSLGAEPIEGWTRFRWAPTTPQP